MRRFFSVWLARMPGHQETPFHIADNIPKWADFDVRSSGKTKVSHSSSTLLIFSLFAALSRFSPSRQSVAGLLVGSVIDSVLFPMSYNSYYS